ncbi:MAG: hypothetical protein J6M53_01970 [Bacteroidaceae bacterium]|nr:hypothetical protein [Bacteroidaceae bacterium]
MHSPNRHTYSPPRLRVIAFGASPLCEATSLPANGKGSEDNGTPRNTEDDLFARRLDFDWETQ